MTVKFKKLNDSAAIPSYSAAGDAGMDIVVTRIIRSTETQIWYGTDLAVEIPSGFVGLVFPRSSISKMPLRLSNSVGVIDSGYRGEIQVRFNRTGSGEVYEPGDRAAQLIILPIPKIEPVEVESLSESDRGMGGFGSTGK